MDRTVHSVAKSQTRLNDFHFHFITLEGFPSGSDGKASVCIAGDPGSSLGWEDPLEKEMAAHSSILA